MSPLKLRVEVMLEIEAEDFIAAAEHQRVLEAHVEQLRKLYPQVRMVLRERRGPRLQTGKRPGPPKRRTGVAPYAVLRLADT